MSAVVGGARIRGHRLKWPRRWVRRVLLGDLVVMSILGIACSLWRQADPTGSRALPGVGSRELSYKVPARVAFAGDSLVAAGPVFVALATCLWAMAMWRSRTLFSSPAESRSGVRDEPDVRPMCDDEKLLVGGMGR